ncbi:MAG TPA: hypothetical protein VJ850_02600 [Candidatus Limnocylindrales bacterium]|nr:hypothetical protein [Candidatus Limnocylindrales bacterium]
MRRLPRRQKHQGHGHPSHHEHATDDEAPPAKPAASPSTWSRLVAWFHEKTRHRFRPDRPFIPRFLKIALAALVVGAAIVGIVGQVEASRRVATAEVKILSVDLPAEVHPTISAQKLIRYSFQAGGREFVGKALRAWSLESVNAAHVCYDPQDPSNNLLVKSSVTCG